MYKGYLTIIILITSMRTCYGDSSKFYEECDYICDINGCNSNFNKTDDYAFCNINDAPIDVNVTLVSRKGNTFEFSDMLHINFKPPKRKCKYEIIILANKSVSEDQCLYHNFTHSDPMHSKHIVCLTPSEDQHQTNFHIYFPYIFTACYSVRFYFDDFSKKIVKNMFLQTNYSYTKINGASNLDCSFEITSNITINNTILYNVNFSMPVVENVLLSLGVYDREFCYRNQNTKNIQKFYRNQGTKNLAHWKFNTTGMLNVEYCFIITLVDLRCQHLTLWEDNRENAECFRFKKCKHVTSEPFAVDSHIETAASFSLFIPHVIMAFALMFIIMYVIYIVHTCNRREKEYVNICNSNITTKRVQYNKQTNVHAFNDKKKIKYEDTDTTNTDIVLLYAKGCESFMVLMAELREILSRLCRSTVHDWYDGVEWNYAAAIGASDWFAGMLHKKYHIIWIDTPAMRSLIAQRFKPNSFAKNSKLHNSVEICDFHDIRFAIIFDLAKRNTEEVAVHRSKHFIVRLKGFDNFLSESDPFNDLLSSTRYCIPEDLVSLCSDLSETKSEKGSLTLIKEEELIERHLWCIKSNS